MICISYSRGAGFIWSSEESGFRHLYRYALDQYEIVQLTQGDWEVTELEAVDEENGWVYFSATKAGPAERHLYRVPLDGGEIEQLTQKPGTHQIEMASNGSVFIDSFSSRNQPTQVSVHSADGERIAWLSENAIDDDHAYGPFAGKHGTTEWGTIESADGHVLHWQLTKPQDFDPEKTIPVIVHVYGGPTGQMVTDSWSRRVLIEQYWGPAGLPGVFSRQPWRGPLWQGIPESGLINALASWRPRTNCWALNG